MRMEYKIGIVAAVLVGLGVTIWNAYNSRTPVDEPPAQTVDKGKGAAGAGSESGPGPGGTDFYGRSADRVNESLTGSILGDGHRDAGMGALDDSASAALEEAHLAEARLAAERALARPSADDTTSRGDPPWWSTGSGTGSSTGTGTTGAAAVARATTYTVKEADQGFWTVSQKVYGNGKHWALIAKANPEADSGKLRVGQILKVPALPVTSGSSRPGASTLPDSSLNGQLVTRPDGKQYYYVQKGDAGFWAVSAKAYGNGKHWAVIAKANPGVTSGSMKIGQQLLVPSRPAERVGGSGAAAAPARTLQPGYKWYTVVDGDAGFWDVARKSYGNGKHWALIAQANPNVNSGRLRKDQKLVVPPLAEASRRAVTPPVGSRVTRSDEPIFE